MMSHREDRFVQVTPFKIAVSDAQLEDLARRLRDARWPNATLGADWDDGTEPGFLRRLTDYWRTQFDWRAQEARLNELPQFIAEVGGTDIHFVHRRGAGPDAFPLILTHGWPGSFAEMEQIIPLLTDPGAHGADPADAFDLVVPSLPGYGFSARPSRPGVGPHHVAGLWAELMAGLGYHRFGAQGGDWGASVSTWLAFRFPDQVAGLHLNFIPGSFLPPLGEGQPPLSPEELVFRARAASWADAEGAYAHIQGTKPQTLAFALADSPVGLASWIAEKFRAWSDCGGDVERAFTLDQLLTDISIYWFTNTIGSSMRLYKESRRRPVHFAAGERVLPPLGLALFPQELPMPPRSWVERVFDVTRWTPMPRGGHFAAMEAPVLLAQEIRAFFRPLRRP